MRREVDLKEYCQLLLSGRSLERVENGGIWAELRDRETGEHFVLHARTWSELEQDSSALSP